MISSDSITIKLKIVAILEAEVVIMTIIMTKRNEVFKEINQLMRSKPMKHYKKFQYSSPLQ
jgi:hypothetical protein